MATSFLSSFNITASGLSAQKYRMDIVSQNMSNAETTRTENGEGPYRRKVVVFTADQQKDSFSNYLRHSQLRNSTRFSRGGMGVKVTQVMEDPSPGKMVYDPEHPDADEGGYVEMPNVDMVQEMLDLMSASRTYDANVTMFNTQKQMALKALELGK